MCVTDNLLQFLKNQSVKLFANYMSSLHAMTSHHKNPKVKCIHLIYTHNQSNYVFKHFAKILYVLIQCTDGKLHVIDQPQTFWWLSSWK